MTFDSRLSEDVFDTLGGDDTLRHAYRVYLWQRVLGLAHHSPSATPGADFCSANPLPSNDKLNGLDAERALRILDAERALRI
jgi:hypothetical protein